MASESKSEEVLSSPLGGGELTGAMAKALLGRLEAEGLIAPARDDWAYRSYEDAPARVKHHYEQMRQKQTLEYVRGAAEKYIGERGKAGALELSVWEAFEALDKLVDASDPDLDLPNSVHALQTAEAIRKAGLPDWMVLTGLLHDLGKVLYLKGSDEDGTGRVEQWGMVGDTFVLGAALPAVAVLPGYNALSPYATATKEGIYAEGCGLDNLTLAWGHDEYLFQVLSRHAHRLPEVAMHMIRFHSCYPHHQGPVSAYDHFLTPKDRELREWLVLFQRFDLYSKDPHPVDISEHKPYYDELIRKYLGDEKIVW
jgi:inositol oxygenase